MTQPARPVRRLSGSGDSWVEGPQGDRYWGRYGAAGLLIYDDSRGVLLQHRASWSHFGGTWGTPGGARHERESAVDGAIREAEEEASVPRAAVRLRFASLLDLGFWTYTTVVAQTRFSFDAVVSDPESEALRWVPIEAVNELVLHPGLAADWPLLSSEMQHSVTLVVDSANVVGSRPDGWWRDRRAATRRLVSALDRLAIQGIAAMALGRGCYVYWPKIVLVVEGAARGFDDSYGEPSDAVTMSPPISVVCAENDGDQAIVDVVASLTPSEAHRVIVVTADRALADRIVTLGATTLGPKWLLTHLDGNNRDC